MVPGQRNAHKGFATAYHVVEYGLFGVVGLLHEASVLLDFDDDDIIEIPLSGERSERFSSLSKTPGCQEYLEIRGLTWLGLETREPDTLFGLLGLLSPLKLKTRLNRNLIGILSVGFAMQLPSPLDVEKTRSCDSELLIIVQRTICPLKLASIVCKSFSTVSREIKLMSRFARQVTTQSQFKKIIFR